MNTAAISTRKLSDFFPDPYDPATSCQLSARLCGAGVLKSIRRIEDADAALEEKKYLRFLRLIAPIISPFPPLQRRLIINHIVYNDLFLRRFEPERFALPLRQADGRFTVGSVQSVHRELDFNVETVKNTLAKGTRQKFHQLYGVDLSTSMLSLRYSGVADPQGRGLQRTPGETPSDSLFKDTNSNFLHLDEKKGLTTIVYLSDVSCANGAFRYVEGFNDVKISIVLKSFHDFMYNTLKITSHDELMQFPPEFRAGINYYHWLEPDKRGIIDSFTTTVVGPAGTAISFAGNRLLHGGGIPYTGERTALFIGHIGRVSHRVRQLLHPISLLQRVGYAH